MYWQARAQVRQDDRSRKRDVAQCLEKPNRLPIQTRIHRCQHRQCTIHRVQRIDRKRTRIEGEPIDLKGWKCLPSLIQMDVVHHFHSLP